MNQVNVIKCNKDVSELSVLMKKKNSHFMEYPLCIYIELFWSNNHLPNLLTFSCNVECTNSFHGVSY